MRARLLAALAGAIACQYALAAAHHIYGGLVYDTPIRLFMPVYGAVVLVASLVLLLRFHRDNSGATLAAFSGLVVVAWVGAGLVDAVYGHTLKDVLFFAGVPADRIELVHPGLARETLVYPPNDLFFELSGVLKLPVIGAISVLLWRVVRVWRGIEVPLAWSSVAVGGMAVSAVVIGVSLFLAYVATESVYDLRHAGIVLVLGFALSATHVVRRARH